MKILFLLLPFLTFGQSPAPQHYPCESSRIGKLITKPLIRNGEIHYELANKKIKKAKRADGVFIMKIDSMQQTVLFRIYHTNKDSSVELQFNFNKENNSCNYFLDIYGKKKSLLIRINSDGEFEKIESNGDIKYSEYRQSQVNTLLKYFE